jgi:peptidoglycan/LPS O-acetylase OafA/YrhL
MQFRLAPHIAVLSPYRPQLDGLRAIAMIGVLYVHFWDDNPLTEFLRVSLFFTVSGFLITHILYRARVRGPVGSPLNFYIRRALRLMPALAVLVLAGVAFDIDGFRERAWWHILPLSNLSFAYYGEVRPWVAGQLWSLSVLEQFYLFWPLILLFLPLPLIYLAAGIGWVLTVFLRVNAGPIGIPEWYVWPILAGDPILLGAVAYLLCQFRRFARTACTLPLQLGALAILLMPYVMWEGFGHSESYRLLVQPALALIVIGAFFGYRGPVRHLFDNPVARFLSRISYAVFVYHLLVVWAVYQVAPDLAATAPVAYALLLVGLTLLAATLSWYLIEAPIARLNVHFPTGGPAKDTGPVILPDVRARGREAP